MCNVPRLLIRAHLLRSKRRKVLGDHLGKSIRLVMFLFRIPTERNRYKQTSELEAKVKMMEAMLRRHGINPTEPNEMGKDIQVAQIPASKKRKPSEFSVDPIYSSISNPSQFPMGSSSNWSISTPSHVFSRRTFKPLPPKHEARILIQEAFISFNSAFPIFHEPSFLSVFENQYTADEYQPPDLWACFNVIFALAHRFRAMQTLNSRTEDCHAWGYTQNALAVVTELTMLNCELYAVQAILGMAIIVQGTPNPRPCLVLIATAVKMAQSLGLHRPYQGSDLSTIEIEQRKRVFWMTYMFDKDISMRTGVPPSQEDDDMDVDLPSETILTDLPINQSGRSFFSVRIGLAIIQGQIYNRICSTRARQQSHLERMVAVRELDAMLEAWKRDIPIQFCAFHSGNGRQASLLADRIHGTLLKFTYFNALNTIHCPLLNGSQQHSGSLVRSLTPNEDTTCLIEARDSMRLLDKIPQGDYACVWLLIHHLHTAATTILSHILRRSSPDVMTANVDLKLVQPVLKLLKTLEGKCEQKSQIEGLEESLRNMWVEAKAAINVNPYNSFGVEIAGATNNNKQPPMTNKKESLEEFMSRIEREITNF